MWSVEGWEIWAPRDTGHNSGTHWNDIEPCEEYEELCDHEEYDIEYPSNEIAVMGSRSAAVAVAAATTVVHQTNRNIAPMNNH